MKTTTGLVACVIAVFFTVNTQGQQQNNTSRIGLVGHGGIDIHMTSFSRIPEAENCCPEFTGGMGSVFGGGALYQTPLSSHWNLDVRAGFYAHSVTLQTTEGLTIADNDQQVPANIRHDLTTKLSAINLDVLGSMGLTNSLRMLAGLTAGYQLSGTYSQQEVFLTPTNATFENGLRYRNQREGTLTSLSGIQAAITAGLSYEFPLNAERTTILAPEVLLSVSPTNVLKETSWMIQRVRAGIALSFVPPAIESDLSDIELFDIARTMPLTSRTSESVANAVIPSVSSAGLNEEGRVLTSSTIRIEEFTSNRVRPLLPYVFFDAGQHKLSARYRQISKDQTTDYSLENFYNLDAMVTYYQLLNVVGKRMQDVPNAKITLTGCRDKSEETGSEDLGKRRATVIKNYLMDTWGIDGARIAVEERGLPSNASSSDNEDGAAENRRVEITSTDPSVLSPVGSIDTMRVFSPAGIRFTPTVSNAQNVKSWTMFVSQNDHIIKSMHGDQQPPSQVDWRIAETARFIPRGVRNLEYMLVVQDSTGKIIPTESQSLQVSEVTLADKSKMGGTDKSVDRYSLILFGFDRSDLSSENQSVVGMVKSKISPRSTVKVVGYTDRTGDAAYNQKLSEQRAKAVATALGSDKISTQGLGETLPLYDNEMPEGRFYSRTVEILVETPR